MDERLLPTVAKANLRRATRHILALKPGATDIEFKVTHIPVLQWRRLTFNWKGQKGSCMISPLDDQMIVACPIQKMVPFS